MFYIILFILSLDFELRVEQGIIQTFSPHDEGRVPQFQMVMYQGRLFDHLKYLQFLNPQTKL